MKGDAMGIEGMVIVSLVLTLVGITLMLFVS
jgi:hypothetical protein